MADTFSFTILAQEKNARAGVIKTPHGMIETPEFSPVGTKASVKALDVDDLSQLDAQVILANTYHLYLQPGIEVIEKFGGFGPFMGWGGPTITDSGGYQVSFLWEPDGADRARSVKITDEGAQFRSHLDGSKHLLTPEKSMEIQHILAADIIMALDQPLVTINSLASKTQNEKKLKYNHEAFKRTLDWERRSFEKWKQLEATRQTGTFQALFGIIQGGTDRTLRRECLEFILDLDFPGVAIGDECIGVDPALTAAALDTVVDLLPTDKPLHALGLGGGPEGIFAAVERGVDLFDNTSVTRMARAGLVFVSPSSGGNTKNKFRLNLTNARYKTDQLPIDPNCTCLTCQTYSRAYLNHLFKAHELLAYRLTSIHNLNFVLALMKQIRVAIRSQKFSELKREWLR